MTERSFRAFTDEFCHFLSARGAWPPYKPTRKLLGVSPNTLADMRKGRSVPEKFPRAFVNRTLSEPESAVFGATHAAIREYLGMRGLFPEGATDTDLVLCHVCEPVSHGRPARGVDYLMRDVDTFARVKQGLLVDDYVRAPGADHIPTLAEWIFACVAQTCLRDGPMLTRGEAVAAAAEVLKTDYCSYLEQLRAWHRIPWVVALARHRRGIVGASIVLPLTEAAYMQVRNGHRASYECGPEDFEVPSRYVLIEAAVERPEALGALNATRPIFMAVLNQVAALAQMQDRPAHEILHVLSFGGTPKNRERLLSAGYQLTDGRMAKTGVELFERTTRMNSLRPRDFFAAMLLRTLGNMNRLSPKVGEISSLQPPRRAGRK